ncbi:MAG: hypothetical protein JSU68_07930 [Phycisphaerales bacterium]|nr:MAG: hypothetical protein JSU68_07930 [Phycisphaerales bacterium]
MNPTNQPTPGHPPDRERKPLSADEQRFLTELLDNLADPDPTATEQVIGADPDAVEYYGEADRLRSRIRAALTGEAEQPLAPHQEQVVKDIEAALAAQRTDAVRAAPGDPLEEPPGILTSVTRHLPPEKAIELYRKITPVFVYQVLSKLDESASLRDVHRIVDHLCSEPVQQRLQTCEHARDGILEEFREVLGRSDVHKKITREMLQRVLAESGAMNDLMAMENCIKLARTKAG